MQTKTGHFPGNPAARQQRPTKTPAAPSSSQATRRETRGDYEGTQRLAMSRNPQQHHLLFSANLERLQKSVWGTRGGYDGRQGLAIPGDPQQHHPLLKLQEGGQEEWEIMVGHKVGRLPRETTPSTLPSALNSQHRIPTMRQSGAWLKC